MSTKIKITVVLLLLILVMSFTFASCNLHMHEYEDYWYSDDVNHWQECSVCSKKRNLAKHTVSEDGWIVDKEATETEFGSRHGKCVVCNVKVYEEIEKIKHTHQYVGEYKSDSHGHWQECSCNEKGNFSEHIVTNWIIDIESTSTTQGSKHGDCDVCHYNVVKSIPIEGHSHSYSDILERDETYHWKECSCGDKIDITRHFYPENWTTSADAHWKECVCGQIDMENNHVKTWIVDVPATTTSTGSKHEECTTCKRVFGTETIDKLPSSTRTADFYAINDFHGSTEKMSTVGGYLKEQKNNNANTVLINSGDMFQGSMESNSNYGKLLTDCMDIVGFDAFVYGNHEFDWGLQQLEKLATGSNVPFLGANIYHWNASTRQWGTFASEFAQKYVVKTLDNGLKIGIIGVIGEKQITSISSNLVQTIGFKEPLPIIKELATELRSEQSCDIVVVSAHASPRGLVGESEKKNDPEEPTSAYDLEKYVDAVFCAHSHRQQNFTVDGIPFIQGGSYGSHVSHVKFSVSATGSVSCTTQENISYMRSWPNLLDVTELIDNSNDKIKDERNQVVTTLSSSLNENPAMARLVSRAIAEYSKNQGYDIALAMVNTARKTLSGGTVTYSDLYESIPFDNVVYIAKVKGSDIINEVNYGNYYWRSSGEAIESNKWYTIAVIDYLLFHQNDNRVYNYFPSAFTSGFEPIAITNSNYDVYNYRLITRDYLLANTIDANDYLYNNNNTDTSLLQTSVTLDYETVGTWGGNNGGGGSSGGDSTGGDGTVTTTHEGTLADPYSVKDAVALSAGHNDSTGAPAGYITGKVSVKTGNYNSPRRGDSSDDLGRIYLVDDDGNEIMVYWLKKFDGASLGNNWDWTGVSSSGELPNELSEGDTLIIYAHSIFTYNGVTPEIYTGYCISINGIASN